MNISTGLILMLCLPFAAFADDPAPNTLSDGPLEGMQFAWIPSGSFQMGSPATEPGHELNEAPVHEVTISGFEMLTTEVTQDVWFEVMGTSLADLRDLYLPGAFQNIVDGEVQADYLAEQIGPRRPIFMVSWTDCHSFVDSLNVLDPAYTYRLPSEAEWEYACRAGTTSPYFWGQSSNSSVVDAYVADFRYVIDVASLRPNNWGLYDMVGNVSEWCEDVLTNNYMGAPSDGSAWTSPSQERAVGSLRVLRNGDRSAARYGYATGSGMIGVGFRIVREQRNN